MRRFRICTAMAMFAMALIVSNRAHANMSYTPWIHEIVRNGSDVEITVNIFDDIEGVASTGDTLPDMDAAYTLGWYSEATSGIVFEDRVFDPESAIEVTEYRCHTWYYPGYEKYFEGGTLDCDGDGTDECDGFCAVAYRYRVIDHCPNHDTKMDGPPYYYMKSDPPCDLFFENEDLGSSNWVTVVQEEGDLCEVEPGCSVVGVGSLGSVGIFHSIISLFY